MDFIKYSLWPAVKVRSRYWWWVIKYGGKKNIPREVIFGAMEKSMKCLTENLNQAVRLLPTDADAEEKGLAFGAVAKVKEFEEEMSKFKQDSRSVVQTDKKESDN
ncbi:MAG: hypothetical protein HYV67_04600 [Candidatus Taylorbacteria bacterium]|nr:hypothetical protein [Candidatus Taylorbacteria bacterium]